MSNQLICLLIICVTVLHETQSSIIDDIQIIQFVAKFLFNNRLLISSKLNDVFHVPNNYSFNSVDEYIKNKLSDTYGELVDEKVNDFYQRIHNNTNKLNEKINGNKNFETFDEYLNNNNKFFGESRVLLAKRISDNIENLSNLHREISDKIKQAIESNDNDLDTLNHNIDDDKWQQIVDAYNRFVEDMKSKNIFYEITDNFFDSLTNQLIHELTAKYHIKYNPLIDSLSESMTYKKRINETLYECKAITKHNDIQKVCCNILTYIEKTTDKKEIKKYIEANLPKNYWNKFETALDTGGIPALKYVANNCCNPKGGLMKALISMTFINNGFPVIKSSDYKRLEIILQFISWIESVIKTGLHYQPDDYNNNIFNYLLLL